MIDAPLIVLGGLLGSAHCLGMCGGFVLTLSVRGQRTMTEFQRQCIYAAGRVFAYVVFGAAAGYAGLRLAHLMPSAVQAQGWLCLAAGGILIVQGLLEIGIVPRRRIGPANSCLVPGMFGALWNAARWQHTFLAGVINGLLPCGLVYAFLALAASSGGVGMGAGTMALFGLGTVPALVVLGTGGGCMGQRMRRRVVTLAAWCVLATGVVTIGRGVSFIRADGRSDAVAACPFCEAP